MFSAAVGLVETARLQRVLFLFSQRLYNELKEHKPSVESVNRNGGKFIKEAKVSDSLLCRKRKQPRDHVSAIRACVT